MADPRLLRHAGLVVTRALHVQRGELVLIEATTRAAPLVRELARLVVRAGGHPLTRVAVEGAAETLLLHGSEEQIAWTNPRLIEDAEDVDCRIAVTSSFNTRALTGVDASRLGLATRSRAGIQKRTLERAAAGELRWIVTTHPTTAAAQEAGMSLAAYEEFLYGALLVDDPDPVAAWDRLAERIIALGEQLGTVSELRIVGDGTDLTVGVGGRAWIPCAGEANLPDGEVFTGPLETSAEGQIRFSFPGAYRGRAIEDVRLRFRGGEVVEASAAHGQEFLEEMLSLDEGARRVGELAFGLNDGVQRFTGDTLLDEKIGGTMHLALGASYPETGGTNASAVHWDLVCDLRRGGEVYADGQLVYRDGRFLTWF